MNPPLGSEQGSSASIPARQSNLKPVGRNFGRHYSAAICELGHVTDEHVVSPEERLTSRYLRPDEPPCVEDVSNYCDEHGTKVLVACESCAAELPIPSTAGTIVTDPRPFCRQCGSPHPWVTREQLIGRLYALIDFRQLDEPIRLEVIDAIAVLSEPEAEEFDERKLRAGSNFKRLAPIMWSKTEPILSALLSAWLKRQLDL
jgi:hypothetical protein